MDFEKIFARIKGILFSPQTEWPVIKAENDTIADVYKNYVIYLAAIPAICGFIGTSFIGVSMPFIGTFKIPVAMGLAQMVLQYVLGLGMLYVCGMIIDALAPNFGGEKNASNAFKVIAYSMTATWVAGILSIVPMLGMLAILAAIYGIYLLYLGLPVMMNSPPERAGGYTAVVVVIFIVLSIVLGVIVGVASGVSGHTMGMLGGG